MASRITSNPSPATTRSLAKAVMVPLWSSGFLIGALATEHAHALALTFWRFLAAAPLMALIAIATRAPWPRKRNELVQIVTVGVLLQAVQFTGIYTSLQLGVPAGLVALFAGSSPLLVAIIAALLFNEQLSRRQWLGSAIGVSGVILAAAAELHGRVTLGGLALALVGLGGLTGGTLVQRRFGAAVDARSANAIQLTAAAVVMVPIAALTQGFAIPTGLATLAPLAWLIVGLSVGAVLLYFWLLRREKSGQATSFLYLVPAFTALTAVPLLGQSLSIGAVAGLALALLGVRMVGASRSDSLARARKAIGRLLPGSAA